MREDRRSFGEEITPVVTGPVSGANDEDEDEDWEDEARRKRGRRRGRRAGVDCLCGWPNFVRDMCNLCLVLFPGLTPTRFLRAAKSPALLKSAADNCSGGTNAS